MCVFCFHCLHIILNVYYNHSNISKSQLALDYICFLKSEDPPGEMKTFSFLLYNLKWYQCLKIHIVVQLFKVLLTYMQ